MLRLRLVILAALMFLGLAVVGLYVWKSNPAAPSSEQSNVARGISADTKGLPASPPSGDKVLGKIDAPITIVEYASLTCPHCAQFHETVLPRLQKTYIDTGKAKLIFRGLALNPLDLSAQMLTRCVSEDKYFPFVSALFVTQKDWAGAPDPLEVLLQISKQAGFTKESFEKCLRNQAALDEINAVRKDFEEKIGALRTPTFIVNGRQLQGEPSFDALEKLIVLDLKS